MSNLVKISEAATLALHAALRLAENPDRVLGTGEIARELGVSEAHLSKVLQRLHRAGILSSVRGPQGGFKLAKPAGQVTLLELYETIEGKLETTVCLFGKPVCGRCCCVLGPLLRETSEKFRHHLQDTTLAAALTKGE